jgi:hypothetical protein
MKMARIAKILEFIGDRVPGVHELAWLVPAFFGLCSAARALGLDVDPGPAAVAVVSVTSGCFLWIILNSLTYRGTERLEETRNELPRASHSLSANPRRRPAERKASTQLQKEVSSTTVKRSHGESTQQEKHYPARLP